MGCAGGTKESPAHLWAGTGQKNGGELLPEACLPIFKQLIRLVNDQPLHSEEQSKTVTLWCSQGMRLAQQMHNLKHFSLAGNHKR